jgi:hypothetical protein
MQFLYYFKTKDREVLENSLEKQFEKDELMADYTEKKSDSK